MLKVAGYNINSFVDYPKKISAVIFLSGCNLDCWFCHNRWLLTTNDSFNLDDVLTKIAGKQTFLDGVVISGGEPTDYSVEDLVSLIKTLKSYGLAVKLDTNGTNPDKLKQLLPLVDYVAMDVKAPFDKYDLVTPISTEQVAAIRRSIELVKTLPEHEFRTTVVPSLQLDDIVEIAQALRGAKAYWLQQYNPPSESCPASLAPDIIKKMAAAANEIVPTKTRGV